MSDKMQQEKYAQGMKMGKLRFKGLFNTELEFMCGSLEMCKGAEAWANIDLWQ